MPLSSETATQSSSSSWKQKFSDFYLWCKVLSITLNIIYMIKTFENIYDAAEKIAAHHQQITEKYAVPFHYGFQVLIGCLMMFCLTIDLVLLTTSNLAIADWYWRPGVFFFAFTCGMKIVALTNLMFNKESFYQDCQKRLSSSIHGSVILISEVCVLQNRLDHIVTVSLLFRDTIICGAYVALSYVYHIRLVQTLKRGQPSDTAMHVIANNYQYPITQ